VADLANKKTFFGSWQHYSDLPLFPVATRKKEKAARVGLFGRSPAAHRPISCSSRQSASLPTIAESAAASRPNVKQRLVSSLSRSLHLTAARRTAAAKPPAPIEQPLAVEAPEERLLGEAEALPVKARRRGSVGVLGQTLDSGQNAGSQLTRQRLSVDFCMVMSVTRIAKIYLKRTVIMD
jgi:hypothetical protein